MNLAPFREFIHELAQASAAEILPLFRQRGLGVEQKADESPVTVADRGAEMVMRQMIQRKFPQHGIVGEEFGEQQRDAEFVWVLDPIDGTKSFITGVPLFGTLIGLLHEARPILGCIHQPVLGQIMMGDGRETTLNGTPVRVRSCPTLAEATLLTTDPSYPGRYQNGTRFQTLADQVRLYRSFGDCYGYLLVASGFADIMVDPILSVWDFLPLVPVMEGAGARMTDWQGRPAASFSVRSAIASVPELHDQVIACLNS